MSPTIVTSSRLQEREQALEAPRPAPGPPARRGFRTLRPSRAARAHARRSSTCTASRTSWSWMTRVALVEQLLVGLDSAPSGSASTRASSKYRVIASPSAGAVCSITCSRRIAEPRRAAAASSWPHCSRRRSCSAAGSRLTARALSATTAVYAPSCGSWKTPSSLPSLSRALRTRQPLRAAAASTPAVVSRRRRASPRRPVDARPARYAMLAAEPEEQHAADHGQPLLDRAPVDRCERRRRRPSATRDQRQSIACERRQDAQQDAPRARSCRRARAPGRGGSCRRSRDVRSGRSGTTRSWRSSGAIGRLPVALARRVRDHRDRHVPRLRRRAAQRPPAGGLAARRRTAAAPRRR